MCAEKTVLARTEAVRMGFGLRAHLLLLEKCGSGTGLVAVRAQRASKSWWWLRRESGANRTSRRRASGCPTSAIFGEGDRRAGFGGDLCGCLRAVAPPKGPARPKTTFEPPEPGRLLSGLRGFKMCGCGANHSRCHVCGCCRPPRRPRRRAAVLECCVQKQK